MTMTMETMSISSNKSYEYEEQVHDTTTTQYQSLYTTMFSSSTRQRAATPDHWPIASPSIATAHFHPIVVLAKDTTSSSYNSKQLHQATRRLPLQFFSINTLLHQQDEECWENNNDDDDDDSDSSSDSYYEQIMKMPQSQSSSKDESEHHIQRPTTPPTSPPPLVNTPQTKKKYVTFNSNNLITSIHYRPRTNTPDISKLYYTEIQIKQFKKEYKHDKRIEKKLNASYIRLDGDGEEEKSLSSCQKFF